MTSTAVKKLGKKIRDNDYDIDKDHLTLLQEYRTSYKGAITDTYNMLYGISKSVYKNSIATYRLKRIESIVNKLMRYPSMQLNRMADIAGCRCILNSNKQVYKLRELIYKNFIVKKEHDYIDQPQSDGYRSLHLHVECISSKKIVEIQLRNKEQHSWATLVEITDVIYGHGLKEKSVENELQHVLYNYSMIHQLTREQKKDMLDKLKGHNFIENLITIFTRNYFPIRNQWLNLKINNANYFLIQASKNEIPTVNSYDSFNLAEQEYFKRFLDNKNTNIVLTYIPQPTFKKLSLAYSNYVLCFHDFIDSYFNIIYDLTIYSLRSGKIADLYKYYEDYLTTMKLYSDHVNNEVKIINSYKNKNRQHKEWVHDIKETIKKRMNKSQRLAKDMNYYLSAYPIRRRWIVFNLKRIIRKYSSTTK